jgi:glutamate-1-semialdehyde 2,1-aminomutase
MSTTLIAALEAARERVVHAYRKRTPGSARAHEAAQRVMPGGDTRSTAFFEPHPLSMSHGRGCRMFDVDGAAYLDMLGNYTSMIHGHAHPRILEAVTQQLQKGTAFATPIEVQTELAAELCRRLPSLERVRFCNSGTEATMCAIRAAKAFTGRAKIIKMEGGYHGSHDAAEISVSPSAAAAGPAEAPVAVAGSAGLFEGITRDVLVAPFNDIESTARLIEAHRADLAAVIVEPVMGAAGIIAATPEYLAFLREATTRVGALLVFDEVVTFRLGYGGAQGLYGIRPDLTSLGKVIGGGFPIGAFGGSEAVMAQFDPLARRMRHSGTYNGNAISMVAGLAALELLTAAEIERLNALGGRLRARLDEVLRAFDPNACVHGVGSLSQLCLRSAGPPRCYRDNFDAPKAAHEVLHLALLNEGFFAAPRGEYALSTPMTEVEIDEASACFRAALNEVMR